MRDINRIHPIMEEFEKAWRKFPDQRFGQFVSNIIGDIVIQNGVNDIFFPEDDKWLAWLKKYNEEHKR